MRTIDLDFKVKLTLDESDLVPCHVYLTANVKWDQQFYVHEMFIEKIERVSNATNVDLDSVSDVDREFILDKAYEVAEEQLGELDSEYTTEVFTDDFAEETDKTRYH